MLDLLDKLSGEEFLYLCGILFLVVLPVFKGIKSDSHYEFWSPLVIVSLIYGYYVVVGPLFALYNGDTDYRTIPHRDCYLPAYIGGFLSLLFINLGFAFSFTKKNKKSPQPALNPEFNEAQIFKYSKIIFGVSLACLLVVSGGGFFNKFNFVESSTESGYEGGFQMYFLMTINTLTLSCILALTLFLNKKKKVFFWIILALTAALYINEAFRFRLVLLLLSSLITYHFSVKRKLNIKLIAVVIIPFFTLMGILEVARTYGQGIDLSKVENSDKSSLESSMNETKVFLSTGYLIKNFEKISDYKGMEMVENTLAFPIPRALWPGKPDGSYLLKTITKLYGKAGIGVAFLNYGEYYISYGWFGIILFSFIFGVYLKWGWATFMSSDKDVFSICFYALFASLNYVIISRGYLPQSFLNYMFFVYPAYYLMKKNRENTALNR